MKIWRLDTHWTHRCLVRATRRSRICLWTFGNSYLALICEINLKLSTDVSGWKPSDVPAEEEIWKAPRSVLGEQAQERPLRGHWLGRREEVGGEKTPFPLNRRCHGSTHSHLLRFVLSLALKGLRKFRVSKIKNEMRDRSLDAKKLSPTSKTLGSGDWAKGTSCRCFICTELPIPAQTETVRHSRLLSFAEIH